MPWNGDEHILIDSRNTDEEVIFAALLDDLSRHILKRTADDLNFFSRFDHAAVCFDRNSRSKQALDKCDFFVPHSSMLTGKMHKLHSARDLKAFPQPVPVGFHKYITVEQGFLNFLLTVRPLSEFLDHGQIHFPTSFSQPVGHLLFGSGCCVHNKPFHFLHLSTVFFWEAKITKSMLETRQTFLSIKTNQKEVSRKPLSDKKKKLPEHRPGSFLKKNHQP